MRGVGRSRWFAVAGLIAVFGLAGCGDDGSSPSAADGGGGGPEVVDLRYLDDLPQLVQPGKEDNFRAEKAQEYSVEGETTVTIEPELADADEETKLARVRELIRWKQVVIGWFLNAYLVEKSSHNANEEYGGFKALTKNGSYEDMDIRSLDGAITYAYRFRQEVGGQTDLLGAMGLTPDEDGRATFELTIGKISNTEMAQLETNGEWYRKSPWSQFDPTKVDPNRLEQVTLTIAPQPRSEDAWIDYGRLFADGLVTIGVHWGWDYHKEYHLTHARAVFDWLVGEGYEAPVASFDELTHESGPLVRTIKANGQELRVEISLFTGVPGSPTDPDTDDGGRLLETLMRESFSSREVVVYSGHSGPFYGFALANWRKTDEGDLDDSEIPGLDMPQGVYQVVLAEGCDTFALGQAFWGNPNKPGRSDLDVITTTSFSNASTPAAVKDFLAAIAGTDGEGRHRPQRYGQILKDLDGNSFWFSTMYGVHGIDDNPHIHPYADVDALCRSCQADADCGAEGMQCTRLSETTAACTAECTADDGCPAGYACEKTAEGSWITARHCVPANEARSCAAPERPAPDKPLVLVNEILADPPMDEALGDANGDGRRDAEDDEFVELVGLATEEVDLGGWTLSDGLEVRFTFPEGTVLEEGAVVLVFGGGDPAAFGDMAGAMVFVAEDRLALTNDSDVVTLADADGEVVDRVAWGPEGGRSVSLVRERDGDPDASFVPHPGASFSPGRRTAGEPF